MAFSTAVRSPSDSATRASHEERNIVSMTDINQAENSTQVQPPRDLESGNCTDREVLKSWETRFHEFFFRKRSQEELMNDALSTTETLIERPRGYPQLAAFQSRKTIFSIYRSFDYLRSRAILELQDQLRVLEEDLERLDVTQASSEKESERNRVSSRATDLLAARREFRERQDTGRKNTDAGGGPGHDEDGRSCSHTTKKPVLSERAMILEEIQHKLSKYDKLLVKTRELAGFRRPTLREKMNLRLWVWRKSPFSYEREELFVHLKSGLITLKPPVQEFEPLEEWVEAVVARLPKQIRKHWYEGDTKNSDMPLFKDSRIQKSAVMIVVLVIISLLAVAVLVMYRMTWQGGRSSTFTNIGLLIGFSLSFSATMGFLTGAKRAELFAATAAYCAVLIVFIGNFNNNEALASP